MGNNNYREVFLEMLKSVSLMILALFSGLSFSQDSSFVFKNDDRPTFEQYITVKELSETLGESNLVLLDVRLKEDFDKDPALIPGATYLDPELLPEWSTSLSKDSKVVVYCVAGKWVSQKVAFLLNEQGIAVSTLSGGIKAWKQSVKATHK